MASRPRRANAGANMQKLLNDAEDEDEFYKENYGGFNEVEDDSDFAQSEKSDDDIVDSDFDLSENEPEPDDATQEKELLHEERAARRKAQVYKDPKVHKPPVRRKKMSDVNNLPKKTATPSAKKPRASFSAHKPEARSLRQSTQQTTFDRIERENRAKRKKQRQKNRRRRETDQVVKLTQEELMEEAKKTEIENTLWLEKFKNLEVEKTKRRPKRDFKESKDFTIQQFGYLDNFRDPETGDERSVIRSVISFPTEERMESFFPKQDTLPDTPQPNVCWVTGQQAKYKDPITNIPYFNVQAYQVIKRLYHRYLEKSPQFRDNERVKEYLSTATDNSDRLKSFSFGQDAKPRYRYDLSQEHYEKPVSLNINPTRSRVNLVGNSLNSANSITISQNSMNSGVVTMSQQPMAVSQQSGMDVQQQQQILQFQPASSQAQRSFTLQNSQTLAGFSSPQKAGQQNILQIQNSGNVITQTILPQQNILQQKPGQNILQSQQQQQQQQQNILQSQKQQQITGQNILQPQQQQQQPQQQQNILQQNPVTKTIQLQPGAQLQTVQIQGSGQQIQTIQIQPAGQLQQGIQAGTQLQLPAQGIQPGTQIQLAGQPVQVGQPSGGPTQQPSQPAQSQTRTVYITAVANNDNAYIIPRQPE